MVHAGIALEPYKIRYLHRSRPADTTKVVAQQVHDHHVFGAIFGAADQVRCQVVVDAWIDMAWPGSFDRSCLDCSAGLHLQKAFGGGGENRFTCCSPAANQQTAEGSRALIAQPFVQLQIADVVSERAACAAGEVGLEQIAAGNQLTDSVDT